LIFFLVTFDVPPQEILTRDSVVCKIINDFIDINFFLKTVSVDAVVYFRIFNPIISVTNVENARYSTQLLAATTLRNILSVYLIIKIE
jgi:erythrocyte band 7 integral membrane protein